MGYNKSPFKMATKSPLAKTLKGNQGKLPQQLQDAIKAAPESPAKQTGPTPVSRTIGGVNTNNIRSGADVPKSTSFGGENYNRGAVSLKGSGAHYYNEGYNPNHEKKGTIKRPGDIGTYHVSRETEKQIHLPKKKASIKSPAQKYKK
jgi:hypothetical protein